MTFSEPSASSPRYTCEIIFYRATNIPIGDLNTLASDPYLLATLVPHPHTPTASHAEPITFRTTTVRRTLNPTFNDARWVVSGVPASGFFLTLELMDEDPGNADDRLGKATLRFPDPARDMNGSDGGALREGWDTGEREYKVHKRHGGLRARVATYLAKAVTRGRVGHRVRVVVSVRVLGQAPRVEGGDVDRVYTLGPHVFARHFSPLATRLTSVQAFKSNQLQLAGPVPASLRHRYVGFRPFVKAMFRARGVEGMLLNRALHKQHRAIYKWDKNTAWGVVGDDPRTPTGEGSEGSQVQERRPDEAFARKFLEMAEYGTEGRIFTYVIMLDGQWRFTETGEEFAIGLLSKHTMHSDVALEIAYSGEFFVRRAHHTHPHHSGSVARLRDVTTPPNSQDVQEAEGADATEHPSTLPPSAYELVIDNDSGTYRPQKALLPVLEEFLARPENLGALGRVRAMDGFDERLKRWKERRNEEKRSARGGAATGKGGAQGSPRILRQASVSSSGSSGSSEDEEAVAAATEEAEMEKKGMNGAAENRERERKVKEEDARRAEDNEDDDPAAQEEKQDVESSGMGPSAGTG